MNSTNFLRIASLLAALTVPAAASAYQAGDWLVKLRLANVDPNDDSGAVFLGGQPIPGSGVTVDDAPTLDISIARMLTDRIALELLLDVTSKHDLTATGATLGPTGKIGDIRTLPPTLLLQYHFAPQGKVRPYIGAGLNYTNFLDEETSASLDAALGRSSLSLDDSFGLAVQAGVDVDLTSSLYLTFDLKWIDLDTTAVIRSPAGRVTVDVDVDPFVYRAGVGWRF